MRNNRLYGRLCTLIYDLDKPTANDKELVVYTQHVRSKAHSILEPMCGSGRFYIPLLVQRYSITGFDNSKAMLESCRTKCSQLNIYPNIFEADIVHYNSDTHHYDYVFIPFGSLSILVSENDLVQSFLNIYNCLNPDGLFIFSTLRPDSSIQNITNWKETMSYPFEGNIISCKQKLIYKPLKNILDIRLLYELYSQGRIIEKEYQHFPLRIYSISFLKEKLEYTGFTQIEEVNSNTQHRFYTIKCKKHNGS